MRAGGGGGGILERGGFCSGGNCPGEYCPRNRFIIST